MEEAERVAITAEALGASSSSSSSPSGALAWLTLIVFLFSLVPVIFPFTIRLPNHNSVFRFLPSFLTSGKKLLTVDFAIGPLLAVLLLLCCTALSPKEIYEAIKGKDNVEPYSIVILFFSLSYLSISIDVTGILAFFAMRSSQYAQGSGPKLFFVFFALSSFLTVVTSNDIVILTLTPLVTYLCAFVGIDPFPILLSEFFAANIWSSMLYIGNPTNIIVAQAFDISFIGFSAWLTLPSITAGLVSLLMLWLVFRKSIPTSISHLPPPSSNVLKDPLGAVFGIILLFLSVLCIISFFWLNVAVWVATLPFALLLLLKDVLVDCSTLRYYLLTAFHTVFCRCCRERCPTPTKAKSTLLPDVAPLSIAPTSSFTPLSTSTSSPQESSSLSPSSDSSVFVGTPSQDPQVTIYFSSPSALDASATNEHYSPSVQLEVPSLLTDDAALEHDEESVCNSCSNQFQGVKRDIVRRFPTVCLCLERMPWKIAPFMLSMFILVDGLNIHGWIGVLADGLHPLLSGAGYGVFAMGFISAICCNIFNNQPMSILFVKILQQSDLSESALSASIYALIMGSNFGANLTLVGALAGIMWSSILGQKGITVSYFRFLKYGLMIMPPVILSACAVLVLEVYIAKWQGW
ncbi:Arsenic transporter [Balamuthia mandrillaris]